MGKNHYEGLVKGRGIFMGVICLLLLTTPAWGGEAPLAVRLLVVNSAPYVGEEVVLTLEVGYRGRPVGRPTVRWPALDHFIVEELPSRPPRRQEDEAGGVLVESSRRLLRPLTPGRRSFRGGVDLEGSFIAAPTLEVRVRPLPERGRPPDFGGAVGEVDLKVKGEGTGTREVEVILRGKAPVSTFPLPRIATGRGERLVPLGEDVSGGVGEIRSRALRYLFLPGDGRRGSLTATLSVFDPRSGRYRLLEASLAEGSTDWRWAGLLVAATFCTGVWLAKRWRRRKGLSLEASLSRLLGRTPSGLCREHILLMLERAGVPPALTDELAFLWIAEDRARFSGHPHAAETAELRQRVAAEFRNHVDKSLPIP